MIQQKLMRTSTVPTFVDGARIAERLLFNYWKAKYFAELLQIMSE